MATDFSLRMLVNQTGAKFLHGCAMSLVCRRTFNRATSKPNTGVQAGRGPEWAGELCAR